MERAEEVIKQMKTGLTPNAAYNAETADQETGSTNTVDNNTASVFENRQATAENKK